MTLAAIDPTILTKEQLMCSTRASIYYASRINVFCPLDCRLSLLVSDYFASHADELLLHAQIQSEWGSDKKKVGYVRILTHTPLFRSVCFGVVVPDEPAKIFNLFWKRLGLMIPPTYSSLSAVNLLTCPRADLGCLEYSAEAFRKPLSNSYLSYRQPKSAPALVSQNLLIVTTKTSAVQKKIDKYKTGKIISGIPIFPFMAVCSDPIEFSPEARAWPLNATCTFHPSRTHHSKLPVGTMTFFEVQIGKHTYHSGPRQIFCSFSIMQESGASLLLTPFSLEMLPGCMRKNFKDLFPLYYYSGSDPFASGSYYRSRDIVGVDK